MSMQMDVFLEKEQIGTLFVWVGPRKGGLKGGGGGARGSSPKFGPLTVSFFCPPGIIVFFARAV
jgi:hypothetical protein